MYGLIWMAVGLILLLAGTTWLYTSPRSRIKKRLVLLRMLLKEESSKKSRGRHDAGPTD
jgi:hypothetical protein